MADEVGWPQELCWATDIHLDHAEMHDPKRVLYFVERVFERPTNVVLLGGDIANGTNIVRHLRFLSESWQDKQIYFVLGNHDYYGSSIDEVWCQVSNLLPDCSNLHWLDRSGVIKLSDKTALVGSGLWCDWEAGNKKKSSVWLNDYRLIEELIFDGAPYNMQAMVYLEKKIKFYAKYHTKQLIRDFQDAIKQGFKNVIVLTHVPPFHEASYYNGRIQDDEWAVHFVCRMAGEQLKSEAEKHPDIKVTVLCGHTHGYGEADILPNLHVVNGAARYKYPAPQDPICYE